MWVFSLTSPPLFWARLRSCQKEEQICKKICPCTEYKILNYKITCNVNKNNNDCFEHVYYRTLRAHAMGIGSPPQQPTQPQSVTWSAIFTRIDARLITDCNTPIFTFIHNIALQAALYLRDAWGVTHAVLKYLYYIYISFEWIINTQK